MLHRRTGLVSALLLGRTDASVCRAPDSDATFANVPPGTYYRRLRGGNWFGGGRSSQQIQVVVP